MLETGAMASSSTSIVPIATSKHGKIVSVVTWFMLAAATLAVVTRLLTKRALSRKLNADDALIVASLIFDIGAGVAVSVQDSNGLGKSMKALSSSQLEVFSKSSYAAGFLYIATLCFAKLSIIVFLRVLTPLRLPRRLRIGIGVFIAICGVVSVIALAFQCSLPHTWNYFDNSCYDRTTFWRFVGVINILTDLALILFPFYIIQGLQTSMIKKLIIVSCFASRSLDIVATAVQLVYSSAFGSSDLTLHLWQWTLCTQIVQCVTIITSCVPYLRPLLEGMQSGMYMSDELRRRGMTATPDGCDDSGNDRSGRDTTSLSKLARHSFSKGLMSNANASQPIGPNKLGGTIGETIGETIIDITSPREVNHGNITSWNDGSQSENSDIIKTTTTTWGLDVHRRESS